VPVQAGSRMWPSRSVLSRTDRARWGKRSAPRSVLRLRVSLLLTWRTSVLLCERPFETRSRGASWQPHLRFSCPSLPGSSPPHHHSTSRRHPRPGGCRLACTHPSLRVHGRGRWPFPPALKRRSPRALAERGAASSAHVDPTSGLFLLAVPRRHQSRERAGEACELGRDDELRRGRRPELVEGVEVLKGHRARVGVHRLLVDRRER
jgi:hypothetical protein